MNDTEPLSQKIISTRRWLTVGLLSVLLICGILKTLTGGWFFVFGGFLIYLGLLAGHFIIHQSALKRLTAEGIRRLIVLTLASHTLLLVAFLFQCDAVDVEECAIDALRRSLGWDGDPIGLGLQAGFYFFIPVLVSWWIIGKFGSSQRPNRMRSS